MYSHFAYVNMCIYMKRDVYIYRSLGGSDYRHSPKCQKRPIYIHLYVYKIYIHTHMKRNQLTLLDGKTHLAYVRRDLHVYMCIYMKHTCMYTWKETLRLKKRDHLLRLDRIIGIAKFVKGVLCKYMWIHTQRDLWKKSNWCACMQIYMCVYIYVYIYIYMYVYT